MNKTWFNGLDAFPDLSINALPGHSRPRILFSEGDANSKADKPVTLISGSNWNLHCWFLSREDNRSRDENQQHTQPTCDAGSGNRTRATAVGGERFHHCAIPASLLPYSPQEQRMPGRERPGPPVDRLLWCRLFSYSKSRCNGKGRAIV